MAAFDVSAVGFLVLDTLCTPADAMPPKGGATFVDRMTMTVAGTAGAAALDCAMLGLKVRLAAEIGIDPMGEWLASELEANGVDIALLSRTSKAQTAMSMLPIGTDGARAAFFVPGSSRTFKLDESGVDAAVDADFVLLGGTGLLPSFDGAASVALLKRAKAKGRTTVFDLILANPETTALVEPLLPYIDYFIPSIDEAAAMSGVREPAEVARWFKERGVRNAILTLESDGAYVDPEHGQPFRTPAHDIDLVDTTGCGDSFTSGFMVGLVKGWAIEDCARFANAVAAQVAMGLGSQGELTNFESAVEAMNSFPLRT